MSVRAPIRSKIKESLEEQLSMNGENTEYFMDIIHDYMVLYDTKKQLQKDIKTRGVSYEGLSASGYKVVKQNQSVKDLLQVNKQMLMILKELHLTTDVGVGGEGEDDL